MMLLLPAQSVNADGSPDDSLPRLEPALKDSALEDVWIRFARESAPDNFIEWTATGRQDYYSDSDFFQEYLFRANPVCGASGRRLSVGRGMNQSFSPYRIKPLSLLR